MPFISLEVTSVFPSLFLSRPSFSSPSLSPSPSNLSLSDSVCNFSTLPPPQDSEALSEMLRGRPARLRSHLDTVRAEDTVLEQESQQHGDLVFVDVVDTYRNVPSKLLQFYKW